CAAVDGACWCLLFSGRTIGLHSSLAPFSATIALPRRWTFWESLATLQKYVGRHRRDPALPHDSRTGGVSPAVAADPCKRQTALRHPLRNLARLAHASLFTLKHVLKKLGSGIQVMLASKGLSATY